MTRIKYNSREDSQLKYVALVQALQKRIDKAETKLQKAIDEGADTVEVLESSMQKLKDKLASAQLELSEL